MIRLLFSLAIAAAAIAPAIAQDTSAEPEASEAVGICYYAGLEYSQWAELPNGQICQPGGMWSYPEKLADTAPADAKPAA